MTEFQYIKKKAKYEYNLKLKRVKISRHVYVYLLIQRHEKKLVIPYPFNSYEEVINFLTVYKVGKEK